MNHPYWLTRGVVMEYIVLQPARSRPRRVKNKISHLNRLSSQNQPVLLNRMLEGPTIENNWFHIALEILESYQDDRRRNMLFTYSESKHQVRTRWHWRPENTAHCSLLTSHFSGVCFSRKYPNNDWASGYAGQVNVISVIHQPPVTVMQRLEIRLRAWLAAVLSTGHYLPLPGTPSHQSYSRN